MATIPRSRFAAPRLPAVALAALVTAIALQTSVGDAAARAMGFGGAAVQRSRGPVTMGPVGRQSITNNQMRRTPSGMSGGRKIGTVNASHGDGRETAPRYPRHPRRPITVGPIGPVGPGGPPAIVNLPPPGFGGLPPPNGASGPGNSSANQVASDGRFVADEILVAFNTNVPQRTVVGIAQNQRLALLGIHRLPLINIALYRFRITDRRPVPTVVGSLRADSRIATVQPNFIYGLLDTEAPIGDPAQYVLSKLHVPQAHELATGNRVLIAIIDSAIDMQNPELAGSVTARFDIIGGTATPHAHGTAMASAIAAHHRLLGIAPAARLVAVRAFDPDGPGASSTSTRLLDGLQYAADTGARVVNMSFAGPADPKLHDMVAALRNKGAVLIAAAGNEGPHAPAAYPAAYPEVIAVTATDVDDKVFSHANRGAYVAVAAPGVDVFVATPNGNYTTTTGTSVAAAHVSGLAALLLERKPGLSPDGVRAILTRTAHDLGTPGRDDDFGAGLVDAEEAVMSLAPRSVEQTVAH